MLSQLCGNTLGSLSIAQPSIQMKGKKHGLEMSKAWQYFNGKRKILEQNFNGGFLKW